MSFGDLIGTLAGSAASITNPIDATGSVAVSIGDLVFGVIGEQTTLTASAVTDNLGNTYSAQNAGTDAGTSTGRAFYSRVTVAGTLTAVHFAATASADDVAVFAAAFTGPFLVSPIDTTPANITSDTTSPFACPSSGTLAQTRELVIGWGVATNSTVWAATAPNLLAGQQAISTTLHVVIGYQTVNATSAVAPNFTAGANPTDAVLGTCSFKQEVITRVGGKGRNVGLVGQWLVNEGSGLRALDTSGNLNHGTLTNTPVRTRDPRFGQVLSTTTTATSYVNIGDLQSANFVSTDSFSVVFWAKYAGSHFTASQSTTTLTVTVLTTGTITLGMRIATTGFASTCTINAFLTGTGGTGTYTVSTSATVGSTTWFGGYQYTVPLVGKVLNSGNFSGWSFYLDLSSVGGNGGFKIVDTAGVSAQAVHTTQASGPSNYWHLIAGVVDRTTQLVKASFDGKAFVTASCSSVGSLQTNATLQIGNANGQDATYHDLRIYNRALSLAEINQIYKLPGKPLSLGGKSPRALKAATNQNFTNREPTIRRVVRPFIVR